jgi:hypothetical protein
MLRCAKVNRTASNASPEHIGQEQSLPALFGNFHEGGCDTGATWRLFLRHYQSFLSDSDSVNLGSNPSPPANLMRAGLVST